MTGLSLETVAEMICGQPGTPVTLTVWSADHGTTSVNVVREKLNFTSQLAFGDQTAQLDMTMLDPLLCHPKVAVLNVPYVTSFDNFAPIDAIDSIDGVIPKGGKAGDPAKHPTPAATPDETDLPVVRIYAIGSTLNGNEQETKEDAFTNLVKEAFDLAGLAKGAPPRLYFHMKSEVLIAKTTVRGHEIIEQIVSALRKSSAGLLPNPPKP